MNLVFSESNDFRSDGVEHELYGMSFIENWFFLRVSVLVATLSNLISNIYPETKPSKSHQVFLLLMIIGKFSKLI